MKILLTGLWPILSLTAVAAVLDWNTIPEPPLPPDPLELVTGDAQPVQDAHQRIAASELLEKARSLSNVRAQPYDLKTSFTASADGASAGTWALEDIAPKGGGYRWTAQGGANFSVINVYPGSTAGALFGTNQAEFLPLRLVQVRSAMFFIFPPVGPQASVRTATGTLNGAQQNCVLLVIGAGNRTFTGGRNWDESEYCVDAQTGLLTQYSPAPGLFIRYDYSSGIRFHDKFIPTAFSISVHGQPVVEARTIAVTDPPARTEGMLDTTGLIELGAGRAMNSWMRMTASMPVPGQPFPTSNATAAMRVVTLHGNASGNGALSEIEILASSDPGLNQTAVAQATAMAQRRQGKQPGATAQSSEVIMTFRFVSSAQ